MFCARMASITYELRRQRHLIGANTSSLASLPSTARPIGLILCSALAGRRTEMYEGSR